jgi:hypothetical protein
MNEIQHIQNQLDDGEYAGYLYNNNAGEGYRHSEVFIVGKKTIIKPLVWYLSPAPRS